MLTVRTAIAFFLVLAAGCSGHILEPSNGAGEDDGATGEGSQEPRVEERDPPGALPEPGSCEPSSVPQPLRRLSRPQYLNVLRDLFPGALGDELASRSRFPATHVESGFVNDAEANTVNTAESNAIEDDAQMLAAYLLEHAPTAVPAVMPCAAAGYADADIDSCIDPFIEEFGRRAYRRPLTSGERGIVRDLYDTVRADQDATGAWAAVMELFLQAPALLYRVERGAGPVEGRPGLVRLTDHEMASRLSFFFLDSMPDQPLFEAAAAGELHTPDQVEAQARRLVADPRAVDTISRFHVEWLHVYELEDAPKDSAAFPEFGEGVRTALLEEVGRFVRHVLEEGDGSLQTLLTTDELPINEALASIYEVEAPGGGGETWEPRVVPHRHGLLTLASVMASHATSDSTHPISRGAFVREEVLCEPLPPFPGDIDTSTPLESTADRPTARERLAPLLENNQCRGCHELFNPLGYALENYDGIGRWRDTENDVPIDASGSIDVADVHGEFAGPGELLGLVAPSTRMARCYASHWLHFATGEQAASSDACSVATVGEVLRQGGRIEDMMVALTRTPAFLYRTSPELAEGH